MRPRTFPVLASTCWSLVADAEGEMVGVPYGSIARMILLYLQSEAVKTRSREVELGKSMNAWLRTMNIDNGSKVSLRPRPQLWRDECQAGLCLWVVPMFQGSSSSTQFTGWSAMQPMTWRK